MREIIIVIGGIGHSANMHTAETGTPIKKCKRYKYLTYTLQYRTVVDVTISHFKSVFTFFTVLGAVIK